MAVTTQNGVEYDLRFGTSPGKFYGTEVRGHLLADYVTANQDGAGDATSSVALTKLPPGRVRLLLPLCYLYVNWTTGSATLSSATVPLTPRVDTTPQPTAPPSIPAADAVGGPRRPAASVALASTAAAAPHPLRMPR